MRAEQLMGTSADATLHLVVYRDPRWGRGHETAGVYTIAVLPPITPSVHSLGRAPLYNLVFVGPHGLVCSAVTRRGMYTDGLPPIASTR